MYKRTVSEYNVQSFYIELNYFRMCVLRIVENRMFHSHLSKEIESESVGALKPSVCERVWTCSNLFSS